MFLGASVISVIEVLEVIIRIVANICEKRSKHGTNKVENLDQKKPIPKTSGFQNKTDLFLV